MESCICQWFRQLNSSKFCSFSFSCIYIYLLVYSFHSFIRGGFVCLFCSFIYSFIIYCYLFIHLFIEHSFCIDIFAHVCPLYVNGMLSKTHSPVLLLLVLFGLNRIESYLDDWIMSACHASVVLSASYLPAIFWFEISAKKTLIRQLQASTVGLVYRI